MEKKLNILFIPSDFSIKSLAFSAWSYLEEIANITLFYVPSPIYLLQQDYHKIDIATCFQLIAINISKKKFDYIVGHANAFFWKILFRLSGNQIPFAIIPDINHVLPLNAFLLFGASQFAIEQDIIYSGSSAAARSFSVFGYPCKPTYPLGIPIDLFKPVTINKRALRNSLGIGPKSAILLYTGRLAQDKDIHVLINIFSIIKKRINAELIICYHFAEKNYACECKIMGNQVGNVHFIENPPMSMLVNYYNLADIFVSAAISIFETFGRSPIEAMACGAVPVLPQYDGFRDTVSKHCGVLVPVLQENYKRTLNQVEFAEEIVSLLLSDKLKEMANNAINCVFKYDARLSIKNMLEDLKLNLLKTITSTAFKNEFSLDKYPLPIKKLWLKLKGRSIQEILARSLKKGDFLPSNELLFGQYHQLWFEHY